jgi:hypothetical protein
MIAGSLFRRRACVGLAGPVLVLVLGLAPACFRGADPSTIVCGDSDHCPSGYECQLGPDGRRGRCVGKTTGDARDTAPTGDAPIADSPLSFDVPDTTSGTGGSTGEDTLSGRGGTASGGATSGGAGSGAGGVTSGAGGTGGVGGTSGPVTGLGGVAGQAGAMGAGGQGSGGNSSCPVAGQMPCGNTCVDAQTDSNNCGGCGKKCDSGQRCTGGSCICDETSCPGGCCSGKVCMAPGVQSTNACGKPGATCVTCSSGSISCSAGTCVCLDSYTLCPGPDTCCDLQNDQNHCGSCSKTCADGCSAGRCFTRISPVTTAVTDIAVNATHVYFTMQNEGTVSRVSRNGGPVETLASSQPLPERLVLDGNNVYWVNWGTGNGGNNLDGSVMKLPLAGGKPVALATMEPFPQDLAVDGTNVYWTNVVGLGLASGAVMKVPIAGGAKVVLASGDAYRSLRGIAIDSTSVYWVNMDEAATPGSIWKVPLAGGTAEAVASNLSFPFELGLSGSMLYFSSTLGIQKVSTAGGPVSVLWPHQLDQTVRIAVDAKSLYLAEGFMGQGVLVKIDLNSGVSTPVASRAYNIALDDTNVFWTDGTSLAVIPKLP